VDSLDNKLKQCGKPTSKEGKELAAKMNEFHFPLTRWVCLDKNLLFCRGYNTVLFYGRSSWPDPKTIIFST